MFQKFITGKRLRLKFLVLFFGMNFFLVSTVRADCQNKELREKVAETAKQEGVDEKELLSIIAHESRCNYFVIAWNLPRRPETARSKFFGSLEEAKSFAEELIPRKQYRVDVGIGQINNETYIQPKGWTLEEVLNPQTALNRVAFVLRESGWKNYHSSNPFYAGKWQRMALEALDNVLSNSEKKDIQAPQKFRIAKRTAIRDHGSLIVFNTEGPLSSLIKTNRQEVPWVIYGNL